MNQDDRVPDDGTSSVPTSYLSNVVPPLQISSFCCIARSGSDRDDVCFVEPLTIMVLGLNLPSFPTATAVEARTD